MTWDGTRGRMGLGVSRLAEVAHVRRGFAHRSALDPVA